MKTNELMFGDWLFIEDANTKIRYNVRVNKIDGSYIYFDSEDVSVTGLSYDCFFPIPLTPEILEKNGFVWRDDLTNDEMFMPAIIDKLDTEECYEIVVEWRDSYDNGAVDDFNREFWDECWKLHCMCKMKSFVIESSNTIYVHELQHALRICGIEKEIVL